MEIEQRVWGFTPHNEPLVLYTMRSESGASVELSNLGAGIVSVSVADRNGKIDDVALGYKEAASYMADGPCMGKTPGRFANRIANGHLEVDGKTYQLAVNNGPNHLHGGPNGFCNKVWEGRVEGNRVVFALNSPDGDENYPADLYAEVVYDFNDKSELEITFRARANASTVVNLTNHAYYNLKGHNSGSVLDNELQLFASKYLPTDSTLIPTGEFAAVEGTPMDFTTAKALGRDIKADFAALNYGKGYDNCYVVDGWQKGKMCPVCVLSDQQSGRRLEVYSDQPAVQIYTGNWLAGAPANKCGRSYDDYDGVAIECQGMPDAPNKPQFPSQKIEAGEMYERHIKLCFSAE